MALEGPNCAGSAVPPVTAFSGEFREKSFIFSLAPLSESQSCRNVSQCVTFLGNWEMKLAGVRLGEKLRLLTANYPKTAAKFGKKTKEEKTKKRAADWHPLPLFS